MKECIATNHAYDRAKERFNWKKKTLDRMMNKAYDDGLSHGDTKGGLNRYITKLWFEHKNCNSVRIYGENIYFFSNQILITLYRLNQKMIKHTKYLSKKTIIKK